LQQQKPRGAATRMAPWGEPFGASRSAHAAAVLKIPHHQTTTLKYVDRYGMAARAHSFASMR